ncbi:MAG TPA: tRNA 2-thiouridine(34) synthase MnmA [Steroidobacteraceae bacterium]|nr:tRNA 2-thiouridine(34) synthase MnmA [Steroidobacteraceae bacterium]
MRCLPADPNAAGTVIVAVSGGVDSAVAALSLVERGHDVQGLFMTNWDDADAYCTAAADYQDAREVCRILNIPLHRANFAAEYRQRVFQRFLQAYAAGETPNPDVLCNREIKFGVCLEHARRLGAAWIATGHYARIEHVAGRSLLSKSLDPAKDQSYFLHAVEPAALSRLLFPLGGLTKVEVRRRARAAGLPVHDKPDSTGICFVGERPFAQFLSRYLAAAPGPIETEDGRVIGTHGGLPFHTLGQRSGLKIGGRRGARPAPWFVAAKDAARNALIVVQSPDHPLLLTERFDAAEINWLVAPDAAEFDCAVKTRHRQADLACRLRVRADGTVAVTLRAPARAVTPGQYAVFYDGDLCLGGGVIADRYRLGAVPGEPPIEYNAPLAAEGS